MGAIELMVVCSLIGLVAWALTAYIPMAPGIARVIQIIALVVIVLIVLSAFGLLPMRDVAIRPLR